MMTIKIQCGCGQLYEFEIEPVDGRMPGTVACPACGADGTEASDAFISQTLAAQPAVAPARPGGLHLQASVATAPAAPARQAPGRRLPGQMDRHQAKHEARAKMLWGDSNEDVLKFLMTNGFTVPEARALAEELFQERAITLRAKGIKNIVLGFVMMCLPIAKWIYFMVNGTLYVYIFALTIMAGVYGLWLIIKGGHMVINPTCEGGDVSEQ